MHLTPRFWGGSLPCSLSSLMDSREAIDFLLVQHFLAVKAGVTTLKLFTY